jgi:2-oxoglutarate dehydrogenase E1 component
VIDDADISEAAAIEKIVMCSGKLFYDLTEARKKSEEKRVAIVRLEQFYPFPAEAIRATLAKYPNSKQLVWAQEEPRNMGGWTFVEPRLENLLPEGQRPQYVGRSASASPATGSYSIHQREQAEIVGKALEIVGR